MRYVGTRRNVVYINKKELMISVIRQLYVSDGLTVKNDYAKIFIKNKK